MNERLSQLLSNQPKPQTHRMKNYNQPIPKHRCEACGKALYRRHNYPSHLCRICAAKRNGHLHSRRAKWKAALARTMRKSLARAKFHQP